MIIAWQMFAPAILLLWFPTSAMLSQKVQLRAWETFESLHSAKAPRPWWWVPSLWVDPVRAVVGTYLLRESLGLNDAYLDIVLGPNYGVMVGVMMVGVVMQLFSSREEGVMLAPLGFVVGMIGVLVPWPVGVAGLVLGITGLFAFRNYASFFMGGMLGVGVLGGLMRMDVFWLLPAVGVISIPLIANLVTGRSMELPTREPS
jgi:hypothetical protein